MNPCIKPFSNICGQWLCLRDEGHTGIHAAEPRTVYDQSEFPVGLEVEDRHRTWAGRMLFPGTSVVDLHYVANWFANFEAELKGGRL